LYGENNELVFFNQERKYTRFNGEYDQNILCEDCDTNIIGKLDDYAAKFTHDEFPQKTQSRIELRDGIEHLVIEDDANYDYAKYKLFLLSLLWRSSISSRPFFNKVKLAASVEEDLRTRILGDQPGAPSEYPIFLFLPPLLPKPGGGRGFSTFYMATMSPVTAKNDDWEIYKFIIEGVSMFFVVSRPANANVEPSVEKDKLMFKITSVEEQSEHITMALQLISKHKR
jgi:hypothetical protein